MPKPWLRLHRAAVHSPKLQMLGLEAVGFWANLLCLTDDEGRLPSIDHIAWDMRLDVSRVTDLVTSLVTANLVTKKVTASGDVTLRMHQWDEHQFPSDGDPQATERKRRQREREKAEKAPIQAEKSGNEGTQDASRIASRDGHEPVTRTDTEQIQIRTETEKNRGEGEKRAKTRDASPTKGTRWESGRVVPDEWIADANAALRSAGLSPVNLKLEAQKFADYWAAKAGKDGVKADWKATWRNWVRRTSQDGRSNGTSLGGGMGPA